MATPMTDDQIVAMLKKWGVKYNEIGGWRTHNRNSKGAWGPVNGFIWHHTGADVTAANARSYAASTLYNGLAELPGPLCQFSIGVDGTVYLVGWGRANHAGGGDPAVLQHVIDEDYTGQLKPTKGNSNGVDGNARFYGVEIQYSGSHAMTDAQYKAALRLSAAICAWHGWSEKSVIAHGEWSSDKWDPGYAPSKIMNMVGVRDDVAHTLTAGTTPEEDDVALTDADIDKIASATAKKTLTIDGVIANPNSATVEANPFISLATAVRNNEIVARRVDGTTAALTAQVGALSAAVGKLAEGGGLDAAEIQAAAQAGAEAALDRLGDALTKEN